MISEKKKEIMEMDMMGLESIYRSYNLVAIS